MNGYICLYRKMLQWEWMQEPLTAHLFTCLLLLANSEDGYSYRGITLHAGQLVTSIDRLRGICGMSAQQIRTRLVNLEKSGEITSKSTNKYRLITICNYATYQYECSTDQQANQQANQQARAKVAENPSKEAKELTSKLTSTLTSQLTSKKEGATETIPASYEDVKSTTNKPANKHTNKPANNIQYSIINIDNNKEKNNIKKEAADLEAMFEDFRKAFKGTKRGFAAEFANFKKKHQQDWKEIVPLLMPALQRMEAWRAQQKAAGAFVPQLPMLQTWLNQCRWTMEYEITELNNGCKNNAGDPAADAQAGCNYEEEF